MIRSPISAKFSKALREDLVKLVAASPYGALRYDNPEDWMPVCQRLGIQPDLLKDAVVLRRQLSVSTDPLARNREYEVDVRLPLTMMKEIREFCAARRWKMFPFTRTLVHQFLLSTDNDVTIVGGNKNGHADIGCTRKGSKPLRIECSAAMRTALKARAAALDAPVSAIIRGLLTDVLTGKKPPPSRIVPLREVCRDEGGYFMPESLYLESPDLDPTSRLTDQTASFQSR